MILYNECLGFERVHFFLIYIHKILRKILHYFDAKGIISPCCKIRLGKGIYDAKDKVGDKGNYIKNKCSRNVSGNLDNWLSRGLYYKE